MSSSGDTLVDPIGSLYSALTARPSGERACVVNDIHSKLNETRVRRVVTVRGVDDARRAIARAADEGVAVAIAGGRHAMGGQQFAADGVLLDTRHFGRIVAFDAERGLVEVEAGIQWPELIDGLRHLQRGRTDQWAIAQKQTGADRLSIGGAVAANVHGRGLTMRPFVADVEALTVVNANGEVVRCSRRERPELFRLAIGGYGLFGFVATVTLRLVPRCKLERVVEVLDVDELVPLLDRRVADGFLYGDFQFAIDPASDDFLRRGICSTYHPVDDDRPIPAGQTQLSIEDWRELLFLAHADKSAAFCHYASHYLRTTGQQYWSDTHQLGAYVDDYHAALDARLGSGHPGSEMISELYVPRERLVDFMTTAATDLRAANAEVIYGTVRLIERDDESFLPWARDRYACVIFNLHTEHTPDALARTAEAFRLLIDRAIERGGSYYLTYHRWARRDQLFAAHPRVGEFMVEKLRVDPGERFQSDWYRGMKETIAGS